jgi:hypothetical protein
MNPTLTRRMYRRILTDHPSCYLTSHSLRHSVVRDISLNGFRLEGLPALPRHTMVMVRIWLPDQKETIDIDQAVVRWVRGNEFGVQIVALSNEADFRLSVYVERVLQQQTVNAVA